MENWLSFAVGGFLIGMMLYGHHKGFIRLTVSAAALAVTLILVNTAMPQVTDFLKNHTKIYSTFEESMKKAVGLDELDEALVNAREPSAQRSLIEEMPLPNQLKEALLENNNSEVYRVLGVEQFTDYVARYLAGNLINILGFLVLFVVIFAAINILTLWLDLVARLPILSGINKLAGAVLGGLEGLIFLWVLCIFVTAFAGTENGRALLAQIENSPWLSFLYDHNMLSGIVMTVVKNIW